MPAMPAPARLSMLGVSPRAATPGRPFTGPAPRRKDDRSARATLLIELASFSFSFAAAPAARPYAFALLAPASSAAFALRAFAPILSAASFSFSALTPAFDHASLAFVAL